eukprot:scaffold2111_cov267-Chaetoceros_neogracile.AAC.31
MSIASSLARRRSQERIVKERELFLKDEENATNIAKWEEKSVHRIRKQDLANRVRRLRHMDFEDLQRRKLMLQSLYEDEKYEWEEELEKSKQVTVEQKINAMRERADNLQQKRQQENDEFVAKCVQRQLQEGCNDVETLETKALVAVDNSVYDRKHSTSLKAKNYEKDNGNSAHFMQGIEEEENEDALEKQRRNMEMKLALDEQVQFNQRRQAQHFERRQREEELQLDIFKKEEYRAKNDKSDKIKLAQENGRQIKERLDRKREEGYKHKRREERVLLDYAIFKERKEINSEMKNTECNQGAAQEYAQIVKTRVEIAENKCEIERIREAAMQKRWQNEDQEQKEREDNRQRLTMEVKACREEQIRQKGERRNF